MPSKQKLIEDTADIYTVVSAAAAPFSSMIALGVFDRVRLILVEGQPNRPLACNQFCRTLI
jgi:hypothetical protein